MTSKPNPKSLFLEALDREPAERAAYLDRACAGQPALRQRVEDLLRASAEANSILDHPILQLPVPEVSGADSDPAAGNSTTVDPVGRPNPKDEEVDAALDFLQASTRPDALGLLGHYEVLEVLGKGGFGIVFRAFDEVLQRVVAVKVMAPHLAATSPARQRFLREARASAAIRHDNVVQVHAIEEQPLPFLVMEFIPGQTLQQWLDSHGPLEAAEVARIGVQLARGLAAAHALGLIHRDLKPANVLLEGQPGASGVGAASRAAPDGSARLAGPTGEPGALATGGRAKLTDFGLARADDDASVTQSGAIAGTPLYMAPEQARGEALDHRADLFSLGSVLYTMCSGRPSFRASGTFAVLKRVVEDEPRPIREIIPEVPEWLCAIIARLHAKDPAGRYQSAAEVAEILERRLGQTASGEAPVLPAFRSRRRRWRAALAVTLAAVAAVGVFLALGRGDRPPRNDPGMVRYQGRVDVLVERVDADGTGRLLRLNQPGALPLRQTDKFRIEGRVDPPAYLYVVWVDPEHDVTPVYPWDPEVGWGSRKALEEPTDRVSLPPKAGKRYTAPDARPGVATMVLFARPAPLDVPDEVVRKWFEELPDLPLPPGGEQAAVWFDHYVEARDPDRTRTFGVVNSDDPFARWQGQLQKVLGDRASFQTAVSFARTGRK
jgi:serine/threonine protein kinase